MKEVVLFYISKCCVVYNSCIHYMLLGVEYTALMWLIFYIVILNSS